jgi:hypothetical protein
MSRLLLGGVAAARMLCHRGVGRAPPQNCRLWTTLESGEANQGSPHEMGTRGRHGRHVAAASNRNGKDRAVTTRRCTADVALNTDEAGAAAISRPRVSPQNRGNSSYAIPVR